MEVKIIEPTYEPINLTDITNITDMDISPFNKRLSLFKVKFHTGYYHSHVFLSTKYDLKVYFDNVHIERLTEISNYTLPVLSDSRWYTKKDFTSLPDDIKSCDDLEVLTIDTYTGEYDLFVISDLVNYDKEHQHYQFLIVDMWIDDINSYEVI